MNIKNLRIEKVTDQNFEEFYKLFEKLVKTQFPEYSNKTTEWLIKNPRGHSKKRLINEIKNNSILVLGAYLKGSIVGFAHGTWPWGGISYVYWLAVDPKFQRKGVGTAILKGWEKIVKEKGGHAVHLDSAEKNLKFYEKLGYKIMGHDLKGYFGADDYLLKKLIQEPKEENYLK